MIAMKILRPLPIDKKKNKHKENTPRHDTTCPSFPKCGHFDTSGVDEIILTSFYARLKINIGIKVTLITSEAKLTFDVDHVTPYISLTNFNRVLW